MKSWVTLYTTYMHVTVCVYVLDKCVHMPKYVIIFWQRSFQEHEQAQEEDAKQQQQQQSRRVRVCATASVHQTHIPNKYNEYKFWYKWCQERRPHNKYLNIITNLSKIEEEQQK